MEVFAVPGLPEVRPGDDLAGLVSERVDLQPGDVVCVASTVVSKAEGRLADLEEFPPGERAERIAARLETVTGETKDPRFAQAVLESSRELLLEAPFLLTVTNFGHVTVNAGIDRSNVPDADLVLPPEAPGESARRLQRRLREGVVDGPATGGDATGADATTTDEDVRVLVTDTCGRPFRYGQRGVAIGWAGMPASRDWRGEIDREGHELEATVQAVVDELAATANLLAGEGDGGTPVVVVRGWEFGDHAGSDNLFRTDEDDLVRQALRDWEFEG